MIHSCIIGLALTASYCIKATKGLWCYNITYKMVISKLYVIGKVIPGHEKFGNHCYNLLLWGKVLRTVHELCRAGNSPGELAVTVMDGSEPVQETMSISIWPSPILYPGYYSSHLYRITFLVQRSSKRMELTGNLTVASWK